MSVMNQVEAAAISTFAELMGNGNIFGRIVDEIERTNGAMQGATGSDKRAKVLADIGIIFDDLVEPIAENILNLLIELGVAYLKASNPMIGAVAGQIGDVIEEKIGN